MKLFEGASLVFYDNNKPIEVNAEIALQVTENSEPDTFHIYKFKCDGNIAKILYKISKNKKIAFIKFKAKANNDISSLKLYNYDTKWTYPIEVIPKYDIAIESYQEELAMDEDYHNPYYTAKHIQHLKKTIKGHAVNRHRLYGEIPDIIWYTKKFNHEYFE